MRKNNTSYAHHRAKVRKVEFKKIPQSTKHILIYYVANFQDFKTLYVDIKKEIKDTKTAITFRILSISKVLFEKKNVIRTKVI